MLSSVEQVLLKYLFSIVLSKPQVSTSLSSPFFGLLAQVRKQPKHLVGVWLIVHKL